MATCFTRHIWTHHKNIFPLFPLVWRFTHTQLTLRFSPARTISFCMICAKWRGVKPMLSSCWGSAPLSKRRVTIFGCCIMTAVQRSCQDAARQAHHNPSAAGFRSYARTNALFYAPATCSIVLLDWRNVAPFRSAFFVGGFPFATNWKSSHGHWSYLHTWCNHCY